MKIYHEMFRELDRPLALAIGFFDGFHRGHREIARATMRMRRPGWRSGVLTFAEHPAAFLRPGTEPPLICTPEERIDLFAAAGFDECFFIRFDETIATLSPEHFSSASSTGSVRAALRSAPRFASATSARATPR